MYHNEKGEGFTGKLATFATFAGITAIALGSAPTIGRSLGRIGVSLAKDISDNPSLFKSVLGHGAGLDDAKNVFSDAFNFIADQLPRIDNVIYSGNAHATRMESMLDSLASHVEESSLDAFVSKRGAIGDALHSLVKGVEKENVDTLMSDTLFNRFMESSQGVQFKFMDQKSAKAGENILHQRKELTKILSSALERAETTRFTANRTSKEILNSGNNLSVVIDAVSSHADKLESIHQRNTNWMGEQGVKHLTIGDITVGGDAHNAVTEYLKQVGVDHSYNNRAHQSLLGFMNDLDFSPLGANSKTDLIDKIHGLNSGLVMGKDGKVFSLAHPINAARSTVSRTLENFQIPLVPGAFNIPGTLGRFMVPDLEGVKYLGKMGAQGELRRAGALKGLSEDAFGIAIGDRVISFDGDAAKQLHINANFINTSTSDHAKDFARARGGEVEDLIGGFRQSVDDDGILKAAWNYVKSNDEHSHTFLQQSLFGRQNELFDLSYSDAGFTLLPKGNLGNASVAAALHSVGKMSGLDSSSINPTLMARFLESGGANQIPAEAAQDAYRQIFSHASAANVDSSSYLKNAAESLNFDSYGEYGSKIQELLRNSDNPAALLHSIVSDSGGGSLLDNYSTVSKSVSPELSRAIAAVGENRERLLQVGPNSSGLFEKIGEGVVGTDSLATLHLQVQRGLIAESVRLSGVNELTSLSGKSLEETLDILHTNASPQLRTALAEKLGLKSSSEVGSLVDAIRGGGSDTYGDVGKLVTPLADFDNLFGMSDNPLVKAKIAEAARVDSVLATYYTKNFEAHSKVMEGLSRGANITEAINKRFGLGGTTFTPKEFDNVPKFYATIKNNDIDPLEPGFGLLSQIGKFISSADIPGFAKGLVDPNEPMTHAGFITNIMMHMPQSVGNAVGLGLTSQEGITVGRSVAGFAVKRVLPAFVALEAYKNYNADMHNMGAPGLDDMAGNVYANAGLTKAKMFDALGVTGALKTLTSTIPGLDQYGSPKSEEEFNEELFYGDEAVRKGRFFVIGSRTPFTGGAVEYLRPNFYRRMKAHWTEASNVQLSNPNYSFLPTLTNPLCLLPDSIVETVSGLKEIKDITTEDYTWNYKNELCKVVATYSRETTEKCRNISVAGRAPFPIKCTNTHPIFAVQTNAPTGKPNRKYARELIRYHIDLNKGLQSGLIHPEWVRAENLKIGDLIAYPRAKDIDSITEVDLAEWYPAATSSFVYPRLSKYTAEAWEELSTWDERLLKDFKSIEEHFLWPERTIEKVSRYLRGKRGAPKRLNRFVALDYDLGYVIGLFLAEGSFGGDSYLKYTLNASEVELADFTIATFREKFGVEGSYTIKDNTLYIVIHGQYLVEWFKTFAAGKAVGKSVPPFFLDSPKEFRLGVILGLFEGDGNYDKTKEALAFTSVSKNLINGFNKLLLSLGFRAALNRKGSGGVKRVCGKLCTTNKAWTLVLDKYSTRRLLAGLNGEFDIPFSGDYLFVPITSIDEYEYSGKVYDIQVEKGESFLTPGGIVHNSPINRFLHSDWQEELTEEDRPYMSGDQLHQFLHNQKPGVYFENAPVGGDGPIGFVSYGAGLPTTVKAFRGYSGALGVGGGVGGPGGAGGGSMGHAGGSGGGSGVNTLGNAYYEPGTAKIRVGNRKDIPVDSLEREGLFDTLGHLGEEATRHMGLYGGLIRNSPLKYESDGLEIQDPEVAFSMRRLFFGGELGELTGPVGEFYRRFITEEHQAYDAFNPLPNRMPGWVPARLRCITKDTFVEVDGSSPIKAGDLVKGMKIRNVAGKIVPISGVKPRQMDEGEKLYEISIGGQLSLKHKVSEEHPFWTPKGWVQIQNLEIGDWVGYPVPSVDSLTVSKKFVDITDYLDGEFAFTDKWVYSNGSQDLATVTEFMEENNSPKFEKGEFGPICAELGVKHKKSLAPKARIKSKLKEIARIPRFIDISSKEWAVFLGYYLAEGSTSNKNIKLSFHENEKTTFVAEVVGAINHLWGINAKIRQYTYDGRGINVDFSNVILAKFLKKYIGTNCRDKKAEVHTKNWKHFVRCFINGDGFYTKSKDGRARAGVKQPYNLWLRYFIWQLLLSQHIVGSITIDGLDYKGYQAEALAECLALDKAFTHEQYMHRRSNSNSGHWYFDGGYFFRKLRSKDEIPQEELVSVTINDGNSFCLLGVATHNTGDPYMRVSHGEFNLPGDAYERLHPYTRPLKARGSMIGLEKDEIVAKMLDPVGAYESDSAEDIMGFGTSAHKRIMRQLGKSGMLVGAEVAGYDPEHNISATIETIVRGQTGLEVVEIKTRGNETFNTDPEKYVDQLMFYMYLTGSKQGHIAHVNRDDPNQVRFATYQYDPKRMQAVFDRVEEARNEIRGLVEEGVVSPYETYDLLSRIEILARTAPDSPEFREYVQHAQTKGGFGGMEQRRFDRAIKSAQLLREDYNLYPYRNVPTETRNTRVRGFTDDGEIITNMGVVKLAGVKFDPQAFTMQDPADLMSQYGIMVGRDVSVTLPQGGFNPEVMQDVTTAGLIGNVNNRLIHSQYADPDYADKSAMASLARQDKINGFLEKILHSDNVISNKWLRVRSGLEQFERGEVFGTENQSYRDLWGNYVEPTFNLVVSKNPVAAAIQGGLVTSFFVKGKEAKGKAALIGGAVAGLVSVGRLAYQTITGDQALPSKYRKQTEFDEYYDLINYVKQSTLADSARKNGYINNKSAGIQMDYSSVSRTREQIDAFGVLALEAERKARQTMYGFDVVSGTLQDALSAIPRRHRQVAESIIVNGTPSEKTKFYNLLPNSERRVLGKFLGKDPSSLPNKPRLENYFKDHFLPDAGWLGWQREVDLEDIKTRAAALEKMKVDQPSRSRVSKARAYTRNIPVPKMHSSSGSSVRSVIDRLVASGNMGRTHFTTSTLPTTESAVTVNMKFVDQSTQKHDESVNSLF